MTVRTNRYRLADGTEHDWDILDGPDTVAILALTDDHQVVLARQFRPGPGLILDELPGGGLEPGESAASAAGRELADETGFVGDVVLRDLDDFRNQLRDGALTDSAHGYRDLEHLGLL